MVTLRYHSHISRPTRSTIAPRCCAKRVNATASELTPENVANKHIVFDDINDDDRKYFSLLPPFISRRTEFLQCEPGMYTLTQPLKPPGQADIRLRMTVYELEDDTIALIGAIAPTKEVIRQVKAIGKEVTAIIIQNSSPEHWYYAPELSKVYPEALVWTVPGFMDGKGVPFPGRSLFFREVQARGVLRILGQDELPKGMECAVFDVPFFNEAAIYLKNCKALLLADTGICLSASDPEYQNSNQFLAEKLGVWDRLGPITRVVLEKNSKEAKVWSSKILDEFEFETIIPAHGSSPLTGNGQQQFRDCFDFLESA